MAGLPRPAPGPPRPPNRAPSVLSLRPEPAPVDPELVTVRQTAVACWCLKLKRRSVYDRVLESCGCPRILVILWQIFEEIRWIINRLLLWRPFACVAGCLESCCGEVRDPKERCICTCCYGLGECGENFAKKWSPVFSLEFLFRSIIQIRLADLMGIAVFIATQEPFINSAFQEAALAGTSQDAQFTAFGKELGNLAAFDFGLAWMFGTRFTAWNLFMGIPFERGIKYHRWIGRWAIFVAFIHTVAYWNEWVLANTLAENSKVPKYVAGYIAMSAAGALFLTSLDWFRRNTFEFFLKAHWFLFILIFWFSDKHSTKFFGWDNAKVNVPPEPQVWALPGFAIVFWAFDIAWRFFISFLPWKQPQVLDVQLLPGNVIRIIMEKGTFEYEAGQYLFVCIPALDMTQWHPFSISTCPQDPTVMLHIRVLGGWTKKLRAFAAQSGINWRELTIYVEGPYGSLSIPLHYYQHVVLISGGIGITPMQSLFNEMVHEIHHGRVMKRIHFVWSVRDVSMVTEFAGKHWSQVDYGDKNIQDSNVSHRLPNEFAPDLMFVTPSARHSVAKQAEVLTHFYLTRTPPGRKEELLAKYPFLMFGRPNVRNILEEARDRFVAEGGVGVGAAVWGVAVMSCGPDKMVADVKKWAAYFGLACHTEVFIF